MPRPLQQKQKKIYKQGRNGHRTSQPQPEARPLPAISLGHEPTPQQLRKQLARQALAQLKPKKNELNDDDFFMVDKEKQQAKKLDLEHEQVQQQLVYEAKREQGKLFEDLSSSYAVNGFGQGIEYKGHTKCITAFQITPEHIYSCSKDKSIIKWDRQTKQKTFLSLGKDPNHHLSDILALALHSNQNILATAGDDLQIKLWDTRSATLIDTLRGHKNVVNGLKFGTNSNNLCSVSADLTLKHWDVSQRGLISTYYEHNGEVLDIDNINADDFITSGYDKQVIAWKTEKQTKVVFKGHQYAVDRVRAINLQRFVTACQDGSVYLWHSRKSKPVFKLSQAHASGWISAMDNLKQSNLLATAGIDHVVKLWAIEGESAGLKLMRQIEVKGIVTDLKMRPDLLAVTECDQLRLGRWVTDKTRNKIKVFPVLA